MSMRDKALKYGRCIMSTFTYSNCKQQKTSLCFTFMIHSSITKDNLPQRDLTEQLLTYTYLIK